VSLDGAGLAEGFHRALVEPLVRSEFGDRSLVGGRFGAGSNVLGLDDAVSTDHDWGLRSTLLVAGAAEVSQFLERELPAEFAGRPVRFALTSDPVPRHRVEVAEPDEFVRARLGVGPDDAWTSADWLSFTGQSVLELVAGPVFTDDDGEWERLRGKLSWYPDDVWRYLVGSSWKQLEQELPFVGRTGARGDDLGSRVLGARLADVAVHLGLLLDRVWAPYAKWVGTVFAASPSGRVRADLERATGAGNWREREAGLCAALEGLLARQAEVGLPVTATATGPFHDREFRGVVEDLADLVVSDVRDPAVRALPLGVGSVGQFSGAVDLLVLPELRRGAVRGVAGS
jgi:hypothetical protein